MLFLNEKLIAVLFGIIAFAVSAITGITQGTLIQVVLTRALIFSAIAVGIGFIFGSVVRDIFLETILREQKKETDKLEEERKKQEEQEEQENQEYLDTTRS